MRPGLRLNWDHVNRFERYVGIVRTNLEANTGGKFRRVTGYIVADKLEDDPVLMGKVTTLERDDMFAQDWSMLFANAVSQWSEFLAALADRDPEDERLQILQAQ